MSGPLRLLLVEDDAADAELVRHALGRAGLDVTVERVDSKDAFTSALGSFAPQVVLSDHSLGPFDALAALEIVRLACPGIPLIVVSGGLDDQMTVALLRAGAEDIVRKDRLARLGASIQEALAVRRPLDRLTPRQLQVLRLVAEGQTTREIAGSLDLSVKTVETHRGQIKKRLEIHDLPGVVRYAVRVGLVTA
jgi:DNA-binding NarL/FixJ family response regulator